MIKCHNPEQEDYPLRYSTLADSTNEYIETDLCRFRIAVLNEQEAIPDQKTLVFFHGFSSSIDLFAPLLNAFVDQDATLRVIAVDLPAHGSSGEINDGKYDALNIMRAIIELLDTPRFPPSFHLCGHSMGGGFATMIANRIPDRITSLALSAPAGLRRVHHPGLLFLRLPPRDFRSTKVQGRVAKRVSHTVGTKVWKGPIEVLESLEAVYRTQMTINRTYFSALRHYFRAFPWSGLEYEFEQLQWRAFPVGVLWGDQDSVLQFDSLERLGTLCPRAKVFHLHKQDHAYYLSIPCHAAHIILSIAR
eukprot:gnl/Dysnectes_brevis/5558_a8049_599.p1 GENE.gnl/Dysnectes_brevis/5558_a8049_599~~gnl/Dysnectes_brevis/5558_a8049_599.p1  ORF type:complete len:305 (-),score=45.16 gnl/Dysnectes_brevis/5558_a8049_599:681-1595(-)